jgi:hypothetical protein
VLRAVTLVGVGLVTGFGAAPAAAVTSQQPAPTPPAVIDGPSSSFAQPAGLGISIARDGTGGVVYLRQVGGAERVFVAALVGGAFEPPIEVDAGSSMGSSAPVIAAGNGGLLLVALVSGGELYTAEKPSTQAPFGSPTALASGGASPAISITDLAKAYLAFTVPDGTGTDVRAAYFHNGSWALEPSPLNASPADNAGRGGGRPSVAAAGDGVAIVAWGENGGIYSRRVWGTAPSVVDEQADGPLPGCTEVSASDPVVGSEGDSSYAVVAFQEQLSCGGQKQTRVLANRLRGSAYDGLTPVDGLSGGASDGAINPQVVMGEYGRGFVTSQRMKGNSIFATALGDNGTMRSTTQVNGAPDAQPPYAVTGTAGVHSDLIAWQQDPGGAGVPEIRIRYASDGNSLGGELVLSSPSAGAADAADGLAAAGDVWGDAAVAWLQGSGPGAQLLAARLYQPPGGFDALHSFQYQRVAQPALAWGPPHEPWGPVTYAVAVDGAQAGQTTSSSLTLPSRLADGPHSWQVTATNPAGQTSTMHPATVFVDTVAPVVTVSAPPRALVHARVGVRITYSDPPGTGEPPSDASGVANVTVGWGDGSHAVVPLGVHRISHVYANRRPYTITLVVTDAAGNAASAKAAVLVAAPKPRNKRGPGSHHR